MSVVGLPLLFAKPAGACTAPPSRDPLTLGVFRHVTVHDGDTFSVEGLDHPVRVLCIDTEEIGRGGGGARTDATSWPRRYWNDRGAARHPVKVPSPFGEETAAWTREWFADVDSVRLEFEAGNLTRDVFGRYLAYVFAYRHGTVQCYNVECVRAGRSPYFIKYGRSLRYEEEFVTAEAEARTGRRGIWNPSTKCYPDYTERLAWWTRCGDAVQYFRERFSKDHRYINLIRDDAFDRLELFEGSRVVLFAMLGATSVHRSVARVELPSRRDRHIRMVFLGTELALFRGIHWERFNQEFVYVRGTIHRYRDAVEIRIADPGDVSTMPLAP